MRGRMIVIALALAAVAVAFTASRGSEGEVEAPANAVRLPFVYSPEKEPLLKPLIERFNAERHTSGSRPVFVEPEVVASGDAQTRIAQGRLKPALWSPASSFWGRLLNHEADQRLVADENPSIVRTPLVIAMWKRLADAYGYPKRPLGYEQLAQLATGGWAAIGRPEFGSFKYVHTNPDFSTSGLSAVAASYYAAVGKRGGPDRGRRHPRAGAGPRARALDRPLRRHDAVHRRRDARPRARLRVGGGDGGDHAAGLQPPRRRRRAARRGLPVGRHVLLRQPADDAADWVSPEQRRAARVFADFLAEQVTPELAGRYGFRPADEDVAPAGLVTRANGVDPAQPEAGPAPARAEGAGQAQAGLACRPQAGERDRSSSTTPARWARRTSSRRRPRACKGFFREAAPQDRIGLIEVLGRRSRRSCRSRRCATNREELLRRRRRDLPGGETRVRDATIAGVQAVEAELDPDAINAVVVLTDGEDTSSARTAEAVVRELEAQRRKESGQIRVFTIAYGSEPNADELADYAKASGGNSYEGGARRHRVDLPVDQLLLLMNRPPTRGELQRALVLNAATKPLNVLVPTGVTRRRACSSATPWLLPVAFVVLARAARA